MGPTAPTSVTPGTRAGTGKREGSEKREGGPKASLRNAAAIRGSVPDDRDSQLEVAQLEIAALHDVILIREFPLATAHRAQ